MSFLLGFTLLLAAAGAPVSFDLRVDATRAVERVRYQFVINNDQPFDQVYPREVFEDRVRLQLDQERLLETKFRVEVTAEMLADEFRRIELTTRDEEQWSVVKEVLGNSRGFIEEVFCRPLVVGRLLRHHFDLDRTIHAAPHAKAREARALFLAGKKVSSARTIEIARVANSGSSVDEMLDKARTEAVGPRVLNQAAGPESKEPISVEPEVAAVLTRELVKAGDVSTILEHRDRFVVYRLISIREDQWKVETVDFPKLGFDDWFAVERRTSRSLPPAR